MKNKTIAILLMLCFVLGITGCAGQKNQAKSPSIGKNTTDLMAGITMDPADVAEMTDVSVFSADTSDFAIALLQDNIAYGEKNENIMVLPVSVITALAMTANGAKEETLSQMLSVIGENQELEELNGNLKAWTSGLIQKEETGVKIANSIWFMDEENRISVEESFLAKNAAYFDAGIYKAPFDQSTLEDINRWVSEHTDGMIDQILDEIPKEAVMYLVNTVAFEAKWQKIYQDSQIWQDTFTNAEMEKKTVDFLHSEESIYLEDDSATGFVKLYEDGYRFVALLPKEGVTLEEYVQGLTGEHFFTLFTEAKEGIPVHISMPKFEAEYEIELKDILTAMGMENAFDEDRADFSGLGTFLDGNIYINRVLHKTYICVDGLGTKAGAATAVEMTSETAMLVEEEYYVTLNRPFVYAIVEEKTNIPLFIGVVNHL